MAETLGVVASAIAVVDLSAKLLKLCSEYAQDVKNAREDIETLRKEAAGFETTARNFVQLLEGPRGKDLGSSQDLRSAIDDARSTLETLEKDLEPSKSRKRMKSFGLCALKWPFQSKDIESRLQHLERCKNTILLALNVDQIKKIQNIDHNIIIDKLPIAEGASSDSHAEEHNSTCLEGTRSELLDSVSQWIEGSDSKTIFWLNGMAGTGKSTIARTISRSRSDSTISFFFKRGEADRDSLKKIVATLTHQLVQKVPVVAPLVKSVLEADRGICDKTIKEQFDQLVWGPLSEARGATADSSRLVIIIDALDECEKDADIRLLIKILSSPTQPQPHVRIFVTSRPELPIRLGFSQVKDAYQDLVLHEISTPIVAQDISKFLASEFDKIRKDFNAIATDDQRLPLHWPGEAMLQKLTDMAIPLFIFAATLCRFVGDQRSGSPLVRLIKVLDHVKTSHGSQLNRTYGPILISQLTDVSKEDEEQIVKDFNYIVGSIVTLANPLSAQSLSKLLEVSQDTVNTRLLQLHSVLNVPSGDLPVRLLHLSFRDYLVDPRRNGNKFWVDQKIVHGNLAKNSLRVMQDRFQKTGENMCRMSYPGMRRTEVDPERIADVLPPELQYACRYWAHHCAATDFNEDDGRIIYEFLKKHFLHWLEAMSFMGCARESISMIQLVTSWLKDDACHQLSDFLADAVRFMKASISAFDEAPLQLYSSALAFAPRNSCIRSTFQRCIPKWLLVWPQVGEDWDACLAVFEGGVGWFRSVAFSHDSKMVASGCEDGMAWIWDVETGKCKGVFGDPRFGVYSVAFSHDSKMLVSGSSDNTVRIWDVDTGHVKKVLRGHDDNVASAVFSCNSQFVASASIDKTVRIWNGETGECERVLRGHEEMVTSVTVSNDWKTVASATYDGTVRIWDLETGNCQWVLADYGSGTRSIAFLDESKTLASVSRNKLQIWDIETGKCKRSQDWSEDSYTTAVAYSDDSKITALAYAYGEICIRDIETGDHRVLRGHGNDIMSMAFSHDSKLLASASVDSTVRVWDIATREHRELNGHSGVVTVVVLSHDSKWVVSGSHDKTVRIWNIETGEYKVLSGHRNWVNSVALSHDLKWVVSGSHDETVRIWNIETGECKVLDGHVESVTSVTFSPDSKMVVSSSRDSIIKVWDVESATWKQDIETHSRFPDVIGFTPDGSGIQTNQGVFPLTSQPGTQPVTNSSPVASRLGVRDFCWVTVDGKDWLWLPAECRQGVKNVSASTVVVGCESGRVVTLGISVPEDVERAHEALG